MDRIFRRAAVSALVALLIAPAGMAQTTSPAKKGTPTEASKPSSAGDSTKKVEYPATPTKKVNAQRDFRNKKAPTFTVEKWLNRQPNRENKTVLIDFWATWCPPCRALVPELVSWHDKYKDDLVIIGISNEAPGDVAKFILDQKVNYAMAIDTKKKMSREVGVGGIPHVLVISSDGIVRWQGFPMGEDPLTEEKLVQIIEADKAARAAKAGPTKKATEKDPKKAPDAKDATKKPGTAPEPAKMVDPNTPRKKADPVKDK
jgi:cytochrome c biogenesis protein CcmG, thiol:disulfide interchange protein DsbE